MVKITICDICHGEKVLSLALYRYGFRGGFRGDFCKTHIKEARKIAAKGKFEFEKWVFEKSGASTSPEEISKWPYRGLN
jgi:hypothetical protein